MIKDITTDREYSDVGLETQQGHHAFCHRIV